MSKRSISYAARNLELIECDTLTGRHGQLRLLKDDNTTFASKKKQEFYCLDCGSGSEGGWWMQLHNVRYGKGCPICASALDLVEAVVAKWPTYRLVVSADKRGLPNPLDIRYQIVPLNNPLPNCFQWTFMKLIRATITSGLRKNERPGRSQDFAYSAVVNVNQAWTDAFKSKGCIRYAGKDKSGSTSPGPFFAIDSGDRLMRSRVSESRISASGVLAICDQERKDKEQATAWQLEAEPFGATIFGYNHSKTLGVKINYKNRFELDRNDSYQRAVETNWGQTKMRKGESLCLIVLRKFFPSDDWRSNSRPDFLTYSLGGCTYSRLELDGYSDDLKLAFEYQGDHHYNTRDEDTGAELTLKEIQARDAFKVVVCDERGIKLLVIPEIELDPELFLQEIRAICLAHRRPPNEPDIEIDSVWDKWNEWCKNPLAKFQNAVVENLNGHRLISPEKEKIGKTSLVTYECRNCWKYSETLAKHLKEGKARKACPKCKGQVAGKNRRDAALEEWKKSPIVPAAFVANVKANSVVGEARFLCDRGHIICVHDLAFAERHVINGVFVCPECEAQQLGVDSSLVALQRKWNESLSDDLKLLGLSILELQPPTNGQATALVICASGGHQFVATRYEASALLRNDCLNDQLIVPSACHECCYPGINRDSVGLLRSTVFHRLHILGDMYPRAKYLSGFDSTSCRDELFSCGEAHGDGTPHPPIRISFRNLQRAARRYPDTHLCLACGLKRGQIVGGGKTLDELVAVMMLMREEISRRVKLPDRLSPPTVELMSGELSGKGEVSTTKTLLRFLCGVPGHIPVMATKDYYFNRAEVRGRGFCPQCVELCGEKKAPLPAATASSKALRTLKMRK